MPLSSTCLPDLLFRVTASFAALNFQRFNTHGTCVAAAANRRCLSLHISAPHIINIQAVLLL